MSETKAFGWDEILPMKKDLERIIASQTAQDNLLNSLVALVSQQAKLLQDMVSLLLQSSQDQVKVNALVEALKGSSDKLAASVAANQPPK